MSDLYKLLSASPIEAAKNLLNYKLLHWHAETKQYVGGIICETEAYLASGDAAAHSVRGKTKANASIFGSAGTIYVHQMRHHFLIDIVTERVDVPSSVLIRALKPVDCLSLMKMRRGTDDVAKLCNDPSNLCKALAIDKSLDGVNIFDEACPIKLTQCIDFEKYEPKQSVRIGIGKNTEAPLRFTIDI